MSAGFAQQFSDLPRAYLHNWFIGGYVLRTTTALLYNFQHLAFGGEFWVLSVIKLLGKALCLVLYDRLLRRLGFTPLTRLAVFTFLLFHPALSDLMRLGDDNWLGLMIVVVLTVLVSWRRGNADIGDLSGFSRSRYLGLVIIGIITLGVKEVSIVFLLMLTLLLTIKSGRGALPRVLPFYCLVGFEAWRLYSINSIRPNRPGESRLVSVLWGHLRYLLTTSPLYIVAIILVLLLACAAFTVLRSDRRDLNTLCALALVSAFGMLVFTSNVEIAATRYVVSSVYLLAIPLAIGLDQTTRRLHWAKAAFVLLFPLFSAGNLYSQSLAFNQLSDEYSDVIGLLERKVADGYTLVLTGKKGDIPGENQGAVALYFEKYARAYYQSAAATAVTFLGEDQPPDTPCVVLTVQPTLAAFVSLTGIDPGRVQEIQAFRRERYGSMEKLASFYSAVNRKIGNDHWPYYDHGGPVVSYDPIYYVYTLSAKSAAPRKEEELAGSFQYINYTRRSPMIQKEWKYGAAYQFSTADKETAKLMLPLGNSGRQRYTGNVRVRQGKVVFGVTDSSGRDLWNVLLPNGNAWTRFPEIPALPPSQKELFVFLFMTGPPASVEINDLTLRKTLGVQLLPPTRRFGALVP